MIVIKDKFNIPTQEIEYQFARSSGPGGQNVNKVNSKAILFWDVEANTSLPKGVIERMKASFSSRLNNDGRLIIQSDRFRDQPQNIRDCQERLKEMILSVWFPPKKRRPTKPTRASKERRIKEKKSRSDTKKNRQKISF